MNTLVNQSKTGKSLERLQVLRAAREVKHEGTSITDYRKTPRGIRRLITRKVYVFFVLWACRYTRSHPNDWAAWKASPKDATISRKFDPGPHLNFPQEIVPSPKTADLFVALYLGERCNILNLADPSSELIDIGQLSPDNKLNVNVEVPIQNTNIPSHFTREWVDILENLPSNPLRGMLGRKWNRYKESVRLDLDAEASNSEPPKGGTRLTPARVIADVFFACSIPVTVRDSTGPNGKKRKTSFVSDSFFDTASLLMSIQDYQKDSDLMGLVEDLMPQIASAVVKTYRERTQLATMMSQPSATRVAGIPSINHSVLPDITFPQEVRRLIAGEYSLPPGRHEQVFSTPTPMPEYPTTSL